MFYFDKLLANIWEKGLLQTYNPGLCGSQQTVENS